MESAAPAPRPCAHKVLIICSHEPELDPRIDWSARYAPNNIERIVVGFHDVRRLKPDDEDMDGVYRIVRLRRVSTDAIRSLACLAKSFFLHAPLRLRIASALFLLVPGILIVLTYEVLNLVINVAHGLASIFAPILRRSIIGAGLGWFLRKLWSVHRDKDPATSGRSDGRAVVRRWLRIFGAERLGIFAAMLLHYVYTNSRLLVHCRTLRPYSVVHANDLDTLIAAVLLKRETGCRVIYDSHEFWPYSDVNASRFEEIAWAFLERMLLKYVDAAFTVSGPLAQAIGAASGRDFGEVPNAEPTTESYDRLTVNSAVDGRVRFLFLGTFSPQRGLEELIEGWAQIGDERAQLVLHGPESAEREHMIALATRLGVIGRTVHFLQPVLESELVASAAEFDVGVIPYKPVSPAYRYCCPNKLSQYMQAGVAILTNDLIYVKEVVRHYDCGLAYDSTRLVTLRDAVTSILNTPDLLARLRRNAKDAARNDFNWQRKSAPLYAAYRQLAQLPP